MEKFKQLQEKIGGIRATIAKVFEQAGDSCDFSKVTEVTGTDDEKSQALQKMSVDCEKLVKEATELEKTMVLKDRNAKEIEDAKNNNRLPNPDATKTDEGDVKKKYKSFGEAYTDAKAYLTSNRQKTIKLEGLPSVKALFSIASDGWEPEIMRTTRMIDKAVRPIQVLDLLPRIPTTENAFTFLEETVVTDTLVVEKAEGAAFGEATLTVVRRSIPIEKIPVHIPATDEQLADVPAAKAYLDNRLPAMLLRRADSQSLNGTGVTPLLEGILNKTGRLAVTPVGSDGIADVILRAIKDIRVTGRALASGIILNPTDWLTERLRKTADGSYIWGSPDTVGITSMWGLPVAQADSLAQGTAVAGDFQVYSAMIERQGIEVLTGFVGDQFKEGEITVRATMRLAFAWYRPAAFAEITLP